MQRRINNTVVCLVTVFIVLTTVAVILLRDDTSSNSTISDSSSSSGSAIQQFNNDTSISKNIASINYPWTFKGDSSESDDDTNKEATYHDRPMSDFISITDIARGGIVTPIVSTRSNKCTDSDKSLMRFTLITDNYPWETSWKIIKMANNTTPNIIIAYGPPTISNYERRTRYIGQFCLQSGKYKLRMEDRNNDGLCCQYGQGSYSVTLNGENIITSDDSNFMVKDYPFTAEEEEQVKTIYIVRHAEKGTDCSSGTCIEGLSSKGTERANKLAKWMENNGIVNKVTHVFATHKKRTYLTVLPVAELANVEVQRYPSGDGVEKLDEEASICPTVQAIQSTPLGSTIIISTHRSAIYGILSDGYDDEEEDSCTGLGLDTSNSDNFPKDDEGKLSSGYSDLWKVEIDANGKPSLEERLILDFDLD